MAAVEELRIMRWGVGSPRGWGGKSSLGGTVTVTPFLRQVGPTERQRLALARRLLPVLLPLHLG